MELKIFHTGPLEVNTYLLMDNESKECILIDVGGSFDSIKKFIDDNGYNLKYILNTHGHFDHILGEVEIQDKYPEIPIYMNKEDTPHFSRLEDELKRWGLNYKTKPLKPTEYIDENSNIYIGKNKINILYTPGHSKGSLSYYIDGKLFSGDVLFQRSIGRTDFIDGDYDTLIHSIKTKYFPLSEDTIVYPGHGPSTTIKEEKKYNTYLR